VEVKENERMRVSRVSYDFFVVWTIPFEYQEQGTFWLAKKMV